MVIMTTTTKMLRISITMRSSSILQLILTRRCMVMHDDFLTYTFWDAGNYDNTNNEDDDEEQLYHKVLIHSPAHLDKEMHDVGFLKTSGDVVVLEVGQLS